MAETAKEHSDRLRAAYDKTIAGFVRGENPRPIARYTFDKFGRKCWDDYEAYLNG
jgi:hypothetical protein